MKHFFIFILLPFILSAQQTYVPDDNFEYVLIKLGLDNPPLNDSVPTKNIDTVQELNVKGKMIASLIGIEDFTSLSELDCSLNQLSSLDLSMHKFLKNLNVSMNILKSLMISQNILLQTLKCYSNELSNLDVSNFQDLIELECANNKLTSIDVTKNFLLKKLYCSFNKLFLLDISMNTELTELDCEFTELLSLNLKMNQELSKLNVSNNNLDSLNLSNNSELIKLSCWANNLIKLDISSNNKLIEVNCGANKIKNLNFSKHSDLQTLRCSSNLLTSLDLSSNAKLIMFNSSRNKLTSLNVKNGNNKNMIGAEYSFDATLNPELFCIQVDDSLFSVKSSDWRKDATAHYSENCNYTGIDDLKFENKSVNISPNPASDYIEIACPPSEKRGLGGVYVLIFDILGIEITSPSLRDTPPYQGGEILRVDISSLSPGVYFVRVGNEVSKFVKM